MPTISIIVPCYNLGEYLDACLESITKQDIGEVEYIFVNDGSTDSTLEKLRKFCGENGEFCKIIDKPNGGVSAARNDAIRVCKGEYIYILDGDDILTNSAVRNMLIAIEKSHADMIISDAIVLASSLEESLIELPIPTGVYSPKEFYEKVKLFPTIPQNLYRTEIIRREGLCFDSSLRYGEVYEFTIKFLCHAKDIYVSHDCFFKYVMRAMSASHKPDFTKDLSILDTLRKWNQNGVYFYKFPSFKATEFKMLMAFSYNKYVKLRLINREAVDNISTLYKDINVRKLCDDIVKSSGVPVRERLLATYFRTTGVAGYKFLVRLLKILK